MTDPTGNFVFRRNDQIGAAAAEDDEEFLQECFVDTGDLESLVNCNNTKRIIVGRTGAGKSALLATLAARQSNVVQFSPHSLAINYIANNTVIQFFENAGVNLSPFYMLLWKHVFVVELLKAKYKIKNDESQRQIMSRLRDFYKRDRAKEVAVEYLESWGNKFWITVDEKIRELTHKIETRLAGSIEGGVLAAKLRGEGAVQLSGEERLEVVERGKRTVSEVQIRELERVIDMLGEDIFSDDQVRFYITIDMLDEEWSDSRIKYRLIRALIDTIRSFRRVRNVKIIAALRKDLLQKVIHSTADAGFQEEKLESLYLHLRWSSRTLQDLLEKRINALIRRRYTTSPISLTELFPARIDGENTIDYFLSRTFYRPRDAIMFLNECITLAEDRPCLTANIIKHAEEEYSSKRLQSLATEWRAIYPNLREVSWLLRGLKACFPLSDLTQEVIEQRYTEIVSDIKDPRIDPNTLGLESLYSASGNFNSVRNSLIRNLHEVGLIGIKSGPTSTTDWSIDSRRSGASLEVRPSAQIYIHPMFYRALEIRP